MRVCVVGSGGREHALATALRRHADVVVAPGNAGMIRDGVEVTEVDPMAIEADLFVIGPEQPLVDGLADELRAAGRVVFGPGADGAQLEGSKAWMKDLLVDAGVPTARHGTFTELPPARAFLDTLDGLYVVKTDGLAAGKGVLVTESLDEAIQAVEEYLSGEAFGAAGQTCVIEEGMTGPELSVLAVCNGTTAVALPAAQDFKRVGDGDTGPNTGGMGAYSPVPLAPQAVVDQVMNEAVAATLTELRRRHIDYRGVLYAGLMLTPSGPRMLEYNVRFGDPETQVVVPRLASDLGELLLAAALGQPLDAPATSADAAVTVALTAEGYPAAPRTGDVISGLDLADRVEGAQVVYAGVRADGDNLVTAGGRVLYTTGRGASIAAARASAYRAADAISWPGRQLRTDIAASAASETTGKPI